MTLCPPQQTNSHCHHVSPVIYRHEFVPVVTKEQPTYRSADSDGNVLVVRPKFPCPRCPSVFSHKTSLCYHTKFECGQSPRFNCPYCAYRTKHVSNVRAHVRRKHPDCSLPLTHGLVPMVRKKQPTYRRIHDIKKSKFPCPKCPSVFSNKNHLYYHLKFVCGQSPRFVCPYCGYRTSWGSNVRAHVHHSLPLLYELVPIARKKQPMYHRVDVDTNLLATKPKFPCPTCPSVFSHKNNLYYHSKFECGQLPRFKCPYCTYRTKHVSNVRAHVRRKHPGNDVYAIDVCKLDS
ncbi:gastrula zinc finger protein XlCGF7.1-like [Monomorium pharaonis]|uniref:gastrula zinc finger protein XlCGF7.1-like n=1 Tax=Monomorium pharaonis TaxID=307658 RepID=UPI0017470162|nr:gastrula zinc finger protein XlCGF7.1-like [Monomorium pharaonis]